MLVKAQPGGKFPMLGGSRYITENQAVEVPNLSYYRRAVVEGSLVIVEQSVIASKAKQSKNEIAAPPSGARNDHPKRATKNNGGDK